MDRLGDHEDMRSSVSVKRDLVHIVIIIIASFNLLVAMIGAIVLTHDSKTEIKRQDIFIQTIVVSYDKIYKNAFRLNHYNFERVNGIDFPFSTLHNTPSL